jgi:drug/metabolite transporter (DMT)-like permease
LKLKGILSAYGKYRVFILSSVVVVFWGSSFPAIKYCLDYYSPESIMIFRFLAASASLGIYYAASKTQLPEKQDLPRLAVTGAVGIFVYMWLINTGTSHVSAGLSSFIIGASPLATLLMSILILKERSGPLCWAGMIISLVGLVLIASTEVYGVTINIGVVMLIGAMLCTSAYNILLRGKLRKYPPMVTTSFSIFFATSFMLIFAPEFVYEFPSAPLSANLLCIYLGIFPAALAYLLWNLALSSAEKTVHVTSFLYLVPFIAAAMSYVWLGEILKPAVMLGGAIIILGLVLANARK